MRNDEFDRNIKNDLENRWGNDPNSPDKFDEILKESLPEKEYSFLDFLGFIKVYPTHFRLIDRGFILGCAQAKLEIFTTPYQVDPIFVSSGLKERILKEAQELRDKGILEHGK